MLLGAWSLFIALKAARLFLRVADSQVMVSLFYQAIHSTINLFFVKKQNGERAHWLFLVLQWAPIVRTGCQIGQSANASHQCCQLAWEQALCGTKLQCEKEFKSHRKPVCRLVPLKWELFLAKLTLLLKGKQFGYYQLSRFELTRYICH